jgi:hypothetical protein
MKIANFTNFGSKNSGRHKTAGGGYEIVQARNPYGSHNLLVVHSESGEAIRHGNSGSLEFVQWAMSTHCVRKVVKHLYKKGVRFQ